MMEYSDELRIRLRDVITNTCNTIGCRNCDLKWDDGCSATDLEDRIYEAELEEWRQNDKS
jgi:hypothetical protein